MSKLNREIKKKIAEQLPEMAAAEMKEFISKAEAAFKEVEKQKTEIKGLKLVVDQKQTVINELNALENDRAGIEGVRKQLEEDQKEFEIEKRVFDAVRAGSQENADNLNSLVKLVFSHDEVKSKALSFSLFGGFDMPYRENGCTYTQRVNIDAGDIAEEKET